MRDLRLAGLCESIQVKSQTSGRQAGRQAKLHKRGEGTTASTWSLKARQGHAGKKAQQRAVEQSGKAQADGFVERHTTGRVRGASCSAALPAPSHLEVRACLRHAYRKSWETGTAPTGGGGALSALSAVLNDRAPRSFCRLTGAGSDASMQPALAQLRPVHRLGLSASAGIPARFAPPPAALPNFAWRRQPPLGGCSHRRCAWRRQQRFKARRAARSGSWQCRRRRRCPWCGPPCMRPPGGWLRGGRGGRTYICTGSASKPRQDGPHNPSPPVIVHHAGAGTRAAQQQTLWNGGKQPPAVRAACAARAPEHKAGARREELWVVQEAETHAGAVAGPQAFAVHCNYACGLGGWGGGKQGGWNVD